MVKRNMNGRKFKMVTPVIVKGAGRFMLVSCPDGHLIKQFAYGDWTEARKIKQVKCYSCGKEE